MGKSSLILACFLLISTMPTIFSYWTSDSLENTAITTMSGEQTLPKISVDDTGFSYISWFSNDAGNYNVRLQYLDKDGNSIWNEHGILISSEPQDTWITDCNLDVDPVGYAVLTFTDIRTGNPNPIAYRISPNGEMMWGENGILLSNNNNFDPSPKVCVTSVGNSVFAWQSMPDIENSQVRLQKISPDGQLLWDDGIVLTQPGIDYTVPFLISAEEDFVYLAWHKETGNWVNPDRGLYVQKLDVDGSFMWVTDVEIYAPITSGPVVNLEICTDDSGGIIFAWYHGSGIDHFHSYIQRIDASGTITMPANGVLASVTLERNHMYPVPAFLNKTQEIVLFFSEQDLLQNDRGLYAQKFDLQGNRLWGDEGIELIGLSSNDYGLFAADGKENTAICIYQAAVFGTGDSKIQAVMLDDQGSFVWPEQFIDLSAYQSQKLHNVMTQYNNGQWVAVWQDKRDDMGDIYAQNIQPDGTLGVVLDDPSLTINPSSFDFQYMYENQTASTLFEVWNDGSGLLNYSIVETCEWVTVSPLSGNSSGEHDIINVTVNTTGLSYDPYHCDILIVSDVGTQVFEVDVLVVEVGTPLIDIDQGLYDRDLRLRPGWNAAQEFVPSFSVLSKIDLYMTKFASPSGDVTIQICEESTSGNIIFEGDISPGDVPAFPTRDWVSIEVGDIAVTTGETYVIVLKDAQGASDWDCLLWSFYRSSPWGSGGPYEGGWFWFQKKFQPYWYPATDWDFTFRTYGYS